MFGWHFIHSKYSLLFAKEPHFLIIFFRLVFHSHSIQSITTCFFFFYICNSKNGRHLFPPSPSTLFLISCGAHRVCRLEGVLQQRQWFTRIVGGSHTFNFNICKSNDTQPRNAKRKVFEGRGKKLSNLSWCMGVIVLILSCNLAK